MNTVLLFIDTSTKICSVGITKNGNQVALKETGDEQFEHGEKITLLIQDCLKEANLEMKELSAVCITSGPGSYTGLRIGASTAKGICYGLDIPLIAIDALYSLGVQATQKHPEKNICAMIDARRMEVFSAIYDANNNELKPISADVLDEHSYAEFKELVVVGDGATKCQDIWNERGFIFDLEIKSSVTGMYQKGNEFFKTQKFEDVAYFEPFYLKEFFSTQKK